jgi:hypothetical protein
MRRTALAALLPAAVLALASSAALGEPALEGDVAVANHPADVQFKIVAAAGAVAFSVPREWGVVSLGSKPPVATAVFLVPDPAARGGPYTTNVVLSIYHLDTDRGREASGVIGKAYGGVPPATGRYKAWTTYASQPSQGDTLYELLDATQTFGTLNAKVGVRCVWPRLSSHAPGYDVGMVEACHAVLDSVAAIPGPYTPGPGEVLRRPG